MTLPNVPTLQVTGQITVEAWIRPTATDGLRDIVAHGYTLNPAAEVYLRINGGKYQVGVYTNSPTTDPVVAYPIPAGDVNHWVHLAGAYDGSAWRLYRNGEPAGSTSSAHGAVAVNGGWTIGGSLANDRPFAGDIDEVRIWNAGRSGADIAAAKDLALDGTELGARRGLALQRAGHARRHAGPPRRHRPRPDPGLPRPAPGVLGDRDRRQPRRGDGALDLRPVVEPRRDVVRAVFTGSSSAAGGYLDAGDAASLTSTAT